MSPVAAGKLTCTTSAEVKRDCMGRVCEHCTRSRVGRSTTYLVGEDQGELNFVGGFSVATAAGGKGPGCPPAESRGKTKSGHGK